jgi:hypothetical protein
MSSTVIGKLARAGRHNGLTWRYVFNLAPTLSYALRGPRLGGEAAEVLARLNRDGVAISSVSELLGSSETYDRLSNEVDSLELTHESQLAQARLEADKPESIGDKTFVIQLLGERPQFDPDSVFAKFALQQPILQLANAYFGMFTRLRYYDVWHTLTTKTAARESQLWHRDREDHRILKMFVYLSDVDDGAGPFTYAPGTHLKGRVRLEPAYHLEGHVRRTTDEQMAQILPADKWIKAVGQKGTIVLADTRGFHKGGFARERDRLMYVCMFTSQASQSKEFMLRQRPRSLPHDRELAFAIT